MKLGTIIELPDGRRATVVYNGLDGIGVKFGEISLSEEDKEQICKGTGNTVYVKLQEDFDLFADALLREPFNGAEIECVGEKYWIISEPEI